MTTKEDKERMRSKWREYYKNNKEKVDLKYHESKRFVQNLKPEELLELVGWYGK